MRVVVFAFESGVEVVLRDLELVVGPDVDPVGNRQQSHCSLVLQPGIFSLAAFGPVSLA